PGDQDAGGSDDVAAWLEDEPEPRVAERGEDRLGEQVRRDPFAPGVGDPQPAAEVQVLQLDSFPLELIDQLQRLPERQVIRLDGEDLRPQVHVDAPDPDAGKLGGETVESRGVVDRDAELRGRMSGARIRVGCRRLDVWVDAEG